MRQIPLITVQGGKVGAVELGKLQYADMMIGVVEAKQGGMTVAELRKSLSVIEAIRAATKNEAEHVLLENDDYQYLRGRIQEHRWPVADPAVIGFIDAVLEAQIVNPNAEKAEKPPAPDEPRATKPARSR